MADARPSSPVDERGRARGASSGGGYLFRLLMKLQGSSLLPGRLRVGLLRRAGIEVGAAAWINHHVSFSGPAVRIGEDAFVNAHVLIEANAPVTIERDVYIAHGAMLMTASHAPGGSRRRAGPPIAAPIVIGAGSWIGARALILPGVTIAPGCVIGAGAVVTRDTEPDGLYLGSPARRTRDLETGERPTQDSRG